MERVHDSARRPGGTRLAKASEPRAEATRINRERRGRRVHRLSLPGVPRSESARIAAIRWSDEEERGGGGSDPVDAPRSRSTRSRRWRWWRRRSALNHPCPFTGAPWNARVIQAPQGGLTTPSPGASGDRVFLLDTVRDRVAAVEVNARRFSARIARPGRGDERPRGRLAKILPASQTFSTRFA